MEIKTVYAVYFSATGNTRKVVTTLANALAESFEVPLELVDFTRPYAREEIPLPIKTSLYSAHRPMQARFPTSSLILSRRALPATARLPCLS